MNIGSSKYYTSSSITGYVINQETSGDNIVRIYDSEFVPESIVINTGDNVTWYVLDGEHVISDIRRSFQSSRLDVGDVYIVVFDQPGFYDYIDQVGKSYGEIIVK